MTEDEQYLAELRQMLIDEPDMSEQKRKSLEYQISLILKRIGQEVPPPEDEWWKQAPIETIGGIIAPVIGVPPPKEWEGIKKEQLTSEARIELLEKMLGELMANQGGMKSRATDRLFISVSEERARVEAALRYGLNEEVFNLEELKKGDIGVIAKISEFTGLPQDKVAMYLRQTLAAGASALTMVVSGGNFPLGAAAYFATQGLLPKLASSGSAGGTKELFKGYTAEGQIDGKPVSMLDVNLPMGLPHDIFGDFRFTCYDRLTGKWLPSDDIVPIQYWSNEDYRYVCLDRVTSKVYHCNNLKPARIYV